jgi:two-component system, NarL family, sensor histidine kinase DesK
MQRKKVTSRMWLRYGKKNRAKGGGIMSPAGRESADELIASSGVTFHLWRLYQHFWLVCLFFPLASLVREPLAWFRLALGLFALLFFAASYTWIMWPHPVSQVARTRTRSRISLLLFVTLSLQVSVFSLVDGPAWLWLFIGVSAIAGMLLPMRTAGVAVVLFTLLPLFITISTHGGVVRVDWWWLIALMLVVRGLGLDMIGVARLGSAIRELHTTRQELARLKVEEERLRLARDLHDLLGQTLSMITLKSELARHLITESPERCAQELSDIERVARQTLREVREAVAGYRQPQLSGELAAARQLLEAAGITYQITPIKEALPPGTSAVLAWAVREGVTNIIRHSRARHCRITLIQENGMVGAEVINDGSRREQAGSLPVRPGLGLSGLRERVITVGGRMEAGPLMPLDKEHFRLSVEVPIQSPARARASQEEQS